MSANYIINTAAEKGACHHEHYRDNEKYYGLVPGNDYVDTLRLSGICLPELKHHSLTDLAAYYGISTDGAHRALNDCRMNQAVYEKLGEILPERLKNADKCPPMRKHTC